ncbi:MAG TPA: hypothetical protein H9716_03115 [Candidatus Enterocloster faecavium]|uniref:Radical SAM protein n=1 Tax=Candidatus Enterocloster faecavium TaxID=2838560 RepID=A0A9D2L6D4_9FIRM|nr:hypothetical protein [Candidatus Enterocloster faecavium]
MAYKRKWEELQEACSRYPEFSPFVLLKLSMVRYGALLTPAALDQVQGPQYSFGSLEPFGIDFEGRPAGRSMPGAILLRDATNVYINYGETYEDPYLVDWDPQRETFVLKEGDQVLELVDFVPRPGFFGKKTSKGTPMEAVADVRAQKLILTAFQRCRLWEGGNQCGFCAFFTGGRSLGEVDCQDICETIAEALKEPGRFSEIYLSGGTDFSGEPPFSNEIDRYIRIFSSISQLFSRRFSSQLMAPAYTKKDLERIYRETLIDSYCPNIEVWDKKLFQVLCPGKEKWIGHDEWVKRTVEAVEVFGKGKVFTQVVAGAELASPHGFSSIEEALESNFQACEFYAKNGVIFLSTIWRPHRASRLGFQPMPPLDYYIRLARGLHEIRRQYGLFTTNDNYKHCGNHPDSELERLDTL